MQSRATVAAFCAAPPLAVCRRLLLAVRPAPTVAACRCATARRQLSSSSLSPPSPPPLEPSGAVLSQTPHGAYFAPPDGLVNAKISAGLDPSLAELGVSSMWPPDLVQRALEWLHCSAELPWWMSITAVVLTARLVLFPVMALHRRNCNLYMNAVAEQQSEAAALVQAVKAGHFEEAEWLQKRMQQQLRERTMPLLLRFMACPLLAFAPVFSSTFYGLHRLSASGLPSLETGGALWFADFTLPDPYLGLPVFSIATTYAMLLTGTEMPKLSQLPGANFTRALLFGLPLVALPLAMHFSAAVVYFWSLNNVLSLAQGALLKRPAIAKAFNIPEVKVSNAGGFAAPGSDAFAELRDVFKAKRDAGMPQAMDDQMRHLREQRRQQRGGDGPQGP